MSSPALGLLVVGNALVDIITNASEEELSAMGYEKGAMSLIDENTAKDIYSKMGDRVETSGGSGANTVAGYASFGGKGAFIGKVHDDALGEVYKKDMQTLGIKFPAQPLIIGPSTGRCMIAVTPDAQRTMMTYLGAATELTPDDIDEHIAGNARVTYLEGYLFDPESAKKAFIRAAELAHKAGHRVALTLSDPFCVDRHRSDFLRLVENHVDILFANEEEIKSLFMQESFDDAKSAISKHVEVAVLTRGPQGAVIVSGDEEIHIDAAPVENVIDTTGAGDQFAAGFLYGYTHGYSLDESGRMGALAAAEVISHYGPRPKIQLSTLIDKAKAA